MMRESVIYQDILAEGEQIGEQRGELKEAQILILRQLARRVGNISPELQVRVKALSLDRLEELGEALLNFTGLADLEGWFIQN
jgi:predicted transposase YdaD